MCTNILRRLSRWGWGSGAVVDSLGRVYGLRSIMVVDASIMPFVPSAPTNLSTIMIAEHVARHWVGSSLEDASRPKDGNHTWHQQEWAK